MDTDSSYGSEDDGRRKAKERYKTRGGRQRRNAKKEQKSNINTGSVLTESSNSSDGDEDKEAAEIWSRPKTKEQIAKEEEEKKIQEKERKIAEHKRKKKEKEEAEEVSR